MNVLAVGAHYDDIEIGCGLSIKRLIDRGANVYAAVLTGSDYLVKEDLHKRKMKTVVVEGKSAFEKLGIIHKKTTLLPNQKMVYDPKSNVGIGENCG